MVAQALAHKASVSLKVGVSAKHTADLRTDLLPAACVRIQNLLQASKVQRGFGTTSSSGVPYTPATKKYSARAGVRASAATLDQAESVKMETGYGGLPLLTPESVDLLPVDEEYSFAVLGDLHLEPAQMGLCHEGRELILKQLSAASGELLPGAQVFQLGDLGGYSHRPGSNNCFDVAKEFLTSFKVPVNIVLGNHDLEGFDDFETDTENLEGWRQRFGEHYWMGEIGNGAAIAIGMSTVRFRAAEHSSHEVYLDREQVDWFRRTLAQHADKPVFVFTHAPPMGSNLTSLQEVHVRNRCAWLNHSERPEAFIDIVRQSPQIKLWFSGHYHLSHDYDRSMNVVNNCLFVQVGVMAQCDRDGRRQSRIVRGGEKGFKIYTLDHVTGDLRLDLVHSYDSRIQELPETVRRYLPGTLTDAPTGPVWLASSPGLPGVHSCRKGGAFAPMIGDEKAGSSANGKVTWTSQGSTLLCVNANQLVQYDPIAVAPVGVVCDRIDGRKIRLLTSDGSEASTSDQEIDVIELVGPGRVGSAPVNAINGNGSFMGEVERIERNEEGGFWSVYQYNKYKLLKQRQAAQEAQKAAGSNGGLPKLVSTVPYSWQR